MVTCGCGKALEKVPSWLASTNVVFVCNSCPNRNVKAITQVTLETVRDPDAETLGALETEIDLDEDEDED